MPQLSEEQKSFAWLSNILDVLRRQCPWDSVQTIDTLRYLTIEEVYELSEAITKKNYDDIRKELGDLVMHLLFYAKIVDDEGRFSLADVFDGICNKLISRHPHISLPNKDGEYEPARQCETPRWEQVKMKEGRRSVMEGVPETLPPLVKSIRIQEKAAGMGFEFPDAEAAKKKVDEEYSEFIDALSELKTKGDESSKMHANEELGDLLFALVKWARFEGLNADDALTFTNQKFQSRFKYIEQKACEENRSVSDFSIDEMQHFWNEAKRNGK